MRIDLLNEPLILININGPEINNGSPQNGGSPHNMPQNNGGGNPLPTIPGNNNHQDNSSGEDNRMRIANVLNTRPNDLDPLNYQEKAMNEDIMWKCRMVISEHNKDKNDVNRTGPYLPLTMQNRLTPEEDDHLCRMIMRR